MQKQLQCLHLIILLAMKTVKRTCVSSLVGVAFSVFEILSLFSFLQIFLLGHRRQKFNRSELAQKFMQVGLMSSACTPILVGVVSPVLEIKLAYSP